MELEVDIKKLIDYINKMKSSGNFKIIKKGPPSEDPADEHIGAIIVDATLSSPRHNYENQVKKRVENLKSRYPAAAMTSGFLRLINIIGLEELLMGWEKNSTEKSKQKQVHETAQFFAKESVETFSDLYQWIKKEGNRIKLKKSIYGVGDKTADYYGVLVCDPEAVAIDERISTFLYNACIDEKRYSYRKKRIIVQEAAKRMGYRPLDLEQSIWHSNPKREQKGAKMDKGDNSSLEIEKDDSNKPRRHRKRKSYPPPSVLPLRQGTVLHGTINNLSSYIDTWLRRDINVFKDPNRIYPKAGDEIILVDTKCNVYQSHFTKPETDERAYLGIPANLMPWHKKHYPQDKLGDDRDVYFEYSGCGCVFWIYSANEWEIRKKQVSEE